MVLTPLTRLGFVLALVAALAWWHGRAVDRHDRQIADEARRASATAAARVTDNHLALQAQTKETARVHAAEKTALVDLIARLDADRRLLAGELADFRTRLAAATAAELRAYAAQSDDHLGRSRKDLERFGVEAAQCASVAWQLKSDLDAVVATCNANVRTLSGATP